MYTFLVDTELEYDEPTVTRKCPPDCRQCMDACPTQAIAQAGRLLPMKCVLMNNMRSTVIPDELRAGIDTRIHGCDACQLACPRNRKVLAKAARKEPYLEELKKDFDLERILLLDEDYYRAVVYPIMYNYIRDLDVFRRNAAIALGNTGDPSHIPALKKALDNENPLVRDAAQWAIDKLSAN
ncbi:epoxyqueuosine reductase [Anaeroselena agilis]|uniref:4Fe-4S double cluster binding domain-containing protein n=1 Tax=Anaeroselena agilis TaxID=3063788 RepID=A0ABU3P1A9_9FIRM|nr:4Fe-4S double cluster binding domain-containing protein [Selenomonadales bacterium 4137-cl]